MEMKIISINVSLPKNIANAIFSDIEIKEYVEAICENAIAINLLSILKAD